MTEDLERVRFESADALEAWLRANQDTSRGIWLVVAKKGSPTPGVTYAEAVDAGLRFGWIDGQARSVDDENYLQRFTPRRPQSPWSMRNVRAAEAMIEEGRMERRGLAEIERARADGRWDRAYAGPKDAETPADFVAALEENAAAKEFYATLNSQNRFAIYYRIQGAKRPETRARRIETFVAQLARGEKFY